MPLEPCLVIANPAANRGRAQRSIPLIPRALKNRGLDCRLVETERPGHATELARQAVAEGAGLVVAAGGDGTVNEVAQALVGADTALGVVPLGSGDDFALALRIPRELEAAIDWLAKGTPQGVDVGRANGRYFVNFVGIGIDGQIAFDFKRYRFLKGKIGYLVAAITEVLRFRAFQAEIRVDDWRVEGKFLLAVVMNGPGAAGGAFLLSPEASVSDGELDLVAISDCPRLKRFPVLIKIQRGKHLGLAITKLRRGKRVTIATERPLIMQLDGEVLPERTSRVEVELFPQALKVLQAA